MAADRSAIATLFMGSGSYCGDTSVRRNSSWIHHDAFRKEGLSAIDHAFGMQCDGPEYKNHTEAGQSPAFRAPAVAFCDVQSELASDLSGDATIKSAVQREI